MGETVGIIIESVLLALDEKIQEVRPIVMEHKYLDRHWEKAIREYDELAIRKDEILKLKNMLEIRKLI